MSGAPHTLSADSPLRVKSGNAHNEPMMSDFHPIDGVIGRQLVDS